LGLTSPLSLTVVLYLLHTVANVLLSSDTRQPVSNRLPKFTPTLSADKQPSNNLAAALIRSTSP
jgi:hypothetical protein